MVASLFSQPPVAYFQPLESPPNTCAPSFISCETPGCQGFGSSHLTEFETISSKVCGWAGELGKNHDLRQGADHCAWLFSEQGAPFHVGAELPSSALISTAQRQPHVDFLSSAEAMKNIFRATSDAEADVGIMVHRLGDWLVIDDGAEISAKIGFASTGDAPTGHGESSAEERRRRAEQRRHAAAAMVEAAQARAAEAQRKLEAAQAALWQAEVEARQAQDSLREALAEVRRLAEDGESLEFERARASCRETMPKEAAARGAAPGPGARIESLDVEVDAPEELQLYRNFLGHSIDMFQDELPLEAAAPGPVGGAGTRGELVALDGPPASFRQVGVWKMAGDASVVIGSRMLCLGNAEHPKLTLYLHNASVLSDTVLLEHWVECLIAGVPEFAACLHRDGAVQSYTLYKVAELRHFLEERLAIGRKLQMTLEVLRWIKRQCWTEGCTYWLSKTRSEPTLKLFKLSNAVADRRSPHKALQQTGLVPSPGQELLLKNTFLHVEESAEADASDEFRRSQSCPARFCGLRAVDEGDGDAGGQQSEQCWSLPLRGRVSALFFRRAVSSPPGPDAIRFLQHALDLEASSTIDGGVPAPGLHRLSLRSCCHLGLAVCELAPLSRSPYNHDSDDKACVAFLEALRRDSPWHCAVGRRCELVPLRGRTRRAPLLFVGGAAWPSRGDSGGAAGAGEPPKQDAMGRIADAFSLLLAASRAIEGEGRELPERDRERVEAIAFPIAALGLLRLASDLVRVSPEDPVARAAAHGLAWRALRAARGFAALDAVRQRPEPQPLFARLPSPEELLVRVEHLLGGVLRTLAASTLARPAGQDSAAEGHAQQPGAGMPELRRKLAKLEQWLEANALRVSKAAEAVSARVGSTSSMMPGSALASCSLADPSVGTVDMTLAPRHKQLLEAAWHYERSIRLLPKPMQRRGPLLCPMMLALAAAATAAAASLAGRVDAGGDAVQCSLALEATLEADLKLGHAEGLADAAGHQGVAALVQASRGHLRALAADALVSRALASGADASECGLSADEASALERLYECSSGSMEEEEDGDREAPRNLGQHIGRLGDRALALTLDAQRSVDGVVEPEVATVLLLMCSGVMQATASQLLAFPPPGVPETERRRAALAMLSRSLEVLPQAGQHGASDPASSAHGPSLCAHAHIMQGEIYLDSRGPGGADRPQQRQQRAQGHLERACAALHGAAGASGVHAPLLLHVHLVRARLLASHGGAAGARRQAEQAIEELVAGCRALASATTNAGCGRRQAGTVGPQAASEEAWKEGRELLLQRLRTSLRELCAREAMVAPPGGARAATGAAGQAPAGASSGDGRWKGLYRAVLQLSPDTVTSVPSLYDASAQGKDR